MSLLHQTQLKKYTRNLQQNQVVKVNEAYATTEDSSDSNEAGDTKHAQSADSMPTGTTTCQTPPESYENTTDDSSKQAHGHRTTGGVVKPAKNCGSIHDRNLRYISSADH